MGFFGNLIKATVQVAVIPVTIIKDVIDLANGNEPDATLTTLSDASDSLESSLSDLSEGDL